MEATDRCFRLPLRFSPISGGHLVLGVRSRQNLPEQYGTDVLITEGLTAASPAGEARQVDALVSIVNERCAGNAARGIS